MSPSNSSHTGRLAEILGAFTYASDLAFALNFEDGLRACYIAMRLAQELGLTHADQQTVYYTALLKEAGCTSWTSELADFWQGDELEARKALFFDGGSEMRGFAPWMLRHVGTQLSVPKRAARMGAVAFKMKGNIAEGFETVCEVNARIARRLDMTEEVQVAIQAMFERWDGKGFPLGLDHDRTPLAARVVAGCFYVVPIKDLHGRTAARNFMQDGRGSMFDPAVVDAFLRISSESTFWDELDDPAIWERVLAFEPAPVRLVPGDAYLDDLTNAFADFIDLKSTHTAAHSRRVSDLATSLAATLRCGQSDQDWIRRAALVHDLGLVAVPSFTLGRPESDLSTAEREQLRLHPYHGERVLARVPQLAPAAELVAAHHERLDGNGYYRGLKGTAIPLGARIIAVADAFDELTHDRPGVPAVSAPAALTRLEMQSRVAFDPDVVQALRACVDGTGSRPAVKRQAWPAGLTEREVEVLRLAARGLTRKQIGQELVITEVTVRHHLEHIYNKTNTSSRVAATMFAMENGLLT
ncbi:MAG TPA: HD domain-containing phosphohydrolase [Tepidiformaceae bacterium]|nr:HD domain-containing phosphohydrolase [Tepidiformaceae bacterium]